MTTYTLERFDRSIGLPSEEIGESSFGALLTEAGNLPLRQLHYRVRVLGLAIRTTIVQTYFNPFNECIEATYIFPIQGEQAVVGCEMWIGDRMVSAVLKERGQARADYKRAISRGHRAALLEENRSETFSMKVGNIGPGEAVQVRIHTVGQLPVVHGEWTLRLPLVVAPRYTSGFPIAGPSVGEGTAVDTYEVPDASTVTPACWLPGFASPVDLKIEADLELGQLSGCDDWARQIRSSLHSVIVDDNSIGNDSSRCQIRVNPGEKVDRDFILRGKVDASVIATSLAMETTDAVDATFALNLIVPPPDAVVPRDVVLVLDRSGSMAGWKMDAARRGISRLVDSLNDSDQFAVLAFDDHVESSCGGRLKPKTAWSAATDTHRYAATRWLANIHSRGGTEMSVALSTALKMFAALPSSSPDSLKRARAIVLITDGQITGEDAVLRQLESIPEMQRPSVYCLGVDRAVNASVLQRLAKYSGGSFELAESEKRLDEILDRFAGEMGAPAITDLEVLPDDAAVSSLLLSPSNQSTLYAGRAVSIYGRAAADRPLSLTVRGRLASGATWETILTGTATKNDASILKPLWGRTRVQELEDRYAAAGTKNIPLKNEIVHSSLSSNVLSRFTAFVAVDESERVNVEDQPHRIVQRVESPEGWKRPGLPSLASVRLRSIPGREKLSDVFQHIDLGRVQIALQVIELVPESVARENNVLPYAENGGTLSVLMSEPIDIATIEKLRFILNRNIRPMIAPAAAIAEAINRYYGEVEGESADSMLQEFTDKAIDFTETEDEPRSEGRCRSSSSLHAMDASGMLSINLPGGDDDDLMDSDLDDERAFGFPPPATSSMRFRRVLSRGLSSKESPVVALVNRIIAEAVSVQATHIIVDIDDKSVCFSFVLQGTEVPEENAPKKIAAAILTALKIIAKVDVTVVNQLQHGSGESHAGGAVVPMSLYFAPTANGTTVLIDLTSRQLRTQPIETDAEPIKQWWSQHASSA